MQAVISFYGVSAAFADEDEIVTNSPESIDFRENAGYFLEPIRGGPRRFGVFLVLRFIQPSHGFAGALEPGRSRGA